MTAIRAMVFAAGRGVRLRPYTDTCPKPLLPVGGGWLCSSELAGLRKAGVTDIVMNTAHLADAFESLPEKLAPSGIRLAISREGDSHDDALETLGGIARALPLLTDGESPFIVAAGDVVHNFPFTRLLAREAALRNGEADAHLVAVPNPRFHTGGDLTVGDGGEVVPGPGPHTYTGLMIVSPRIFSGVAPVRAKLFPWLWQFRCTAEVWDGYWENIGTPADYESFRGDPARQALSLIPPVPETRP